MKSRQHVLETLLLQHFDFETHIQERQIEHEERIRTEVQ